MLEDTGERVIPEKMKITNILLLEHLARYHFATMFTSGRVLDIACGSGYGTHIIAKLCKKRVHKIIGIDYSKEAVRYARKTYYHLLTSYIVKDAVDPNLPDELGKFDTILSFETIEHIQDEAQFLQNLFNLLKPNGVLLLSTPFGLGRHKPCSVPFHVHQLSKKEFKHLFQNYPFSSIKFYFQKGVFITPADFETDEHYPLGIVVCRK